MPLNLPNLAIRTGSLAALALLAAALSGCQGISGIQSFTQVRVIDASPDAPALDIHQNSSVGLYNIGFGTVSSYMPVAPGPYTHSAYTAGTQQRLAAVRGTFSTGNQYTVLAGNIAASLQMSVLKDQSTPAPSGQVALRFLDQTTRAGAVDVYLLPAGSSFAGLLPLATAATFGSNTGYINAPSGTYSIVAFPAGTIPLTPATPAFTGAQANYPAGSARTIILIDQPPAQQAAQPSTAQQPSTAPTLQLITAYDYDTPAS
jgi:hypothetical protein